MKLSIAVHSGYGPNDNQTHEVYNNRDLCPWQLTVRTVPAGLRMAVFLARRDLQEVDEIDYSSI